jgi:catechol 1,2-dioxygenase
MYSFFDKSQSKYNLRRRIETDANGRYEFRTVMPAGYGCPPDGPTQKLLDTLGRHDQRPAHIHFIVSAPGHRQLTTQINIAGDKYLYDDFAFATREGLIPKIVRQNDANRIREKGLKAAFAEIEFDFTLRPVGKSAAHDIIHRRRVEAA